MIGGGHLLDKSLQLRLWSMSMYIQPSFRHSSGEGQRNTNPLHLIAQKVQQQQEYPTLMSNCL